MRLVSIALLVSVGLTATACSSPEPEPAPTPAPPQKTPGDLRREAQTKAIEDQVTAQLEAQADTKGARPH